MRDDLSSVKLVNSRSLLNEIDKRLSWCLRALESLRGQVGQVAGHQRIALVRTKLEEAQMWAERLPSSKTDTVVLPD